MQTSPSNEGLLSSGYPRNHLEFRVDPFVYPRTTGASVSPWFRNLMSVYPGDVNVVNTRTRPYSSLSVGGSNSSCLLRDFALTRTHSMNFGWRNSCRCSGPPNNSACAHLLLFSWSSLIAEVGLTYSYVKEFLSAFLSARNLILH